LEPKVKKPKKRPPRGGTPKTNVFSCAVSLFRPKVGVPASKWGGGIANLRSILRCQNLVKMSSCVPWFFGPPRPIDLKTSRPIDPKKTRLRPIFWFGGVRDFLVKRTILIRLKPPSLGGQSGFHKRQTWGVEWTTSETGSLDPHVGPEMTRPQKGSGHP
jgi:hypothetical protein